MGNGNVGMLWQDVEHMSSVGFPIFLRGAWARRVGAAISERLPIVEGDWDLDQSPSLSPFMNNIELCHPNHNFNKHCFCRER